MCSNPPVQLAVIFFNKLKHELSLSSNTDRCSPALGLTCLPGNTITCAESRSLRLISKIRMKLWRCIFFGGKVFI